MIISHINCGNVATAGRQRAGSNATRALSKIELADFLARARLPHVNSGRGAGFSSDHSLAISADVHGEDVIAVAFSLDSVVVFRLHLSGSATVELLLTSLSIHDHA